jgi:hypothetical protein
MIHVMIRLACLAFSLLLIAAARTPTRAPSPTPVPAQGRAEPASSLRPLVATWGGDSADWVKRLGVRQIRQGCPDTASTCLTRMRAAAKAEGVSAVSVSFNADDSTWTDLQKRADEYAKLSGTAEGIAPIVELSLDDFLRRFDPTVSTAEKFLRRLGMKDSQAASSSFARVLDTIRGAPRPLSFGITLYEDELDSAVLEGIPLATRAKLDVVYLYLHYRKNAAQYPEAVRKARALFPSARIIGGVYAYDRLAYLPCEQGDKKLCSLQEELAEFRRALEAQRDLLKRGELAGLEFYPGFFGREERWPGWEKPRICAPESHASCVANTKALRELSLQVLGPAP